MRSALIFRGYSRGYPYLNCMLLIISDIIYIGNRLFNRAALSVADPREYPGNCPQNYPQEIRTNAIFFVRNELDLKADVESTIARQASVAT